MHNASHPHPHSSYICYLVWLAWFAIVTDHSVYVGSGTRFINPVEGWFSLTNHVAVLEVSISDIYLVGGVYLDRHLPLRLFAYMLQLCVFNCLT